MRRAISFIFFLSISIVIIGQVSHWGKQDQYLINQTTKTFQLVETILSENPPAITEPSHARKAALYLLDGVFHDTRLDGNQVLSQFAEERLGKVIEDIQTPLNDGMKVYKLYNHSFIVKTKSVTFAFDLYRGCSMQETPTLISDETMKALVEACDIMFLTHDHPDHIDPVIVNMFTDMGKQVIAPENSLVGNEQITRIRSEEIIAETFEIGKYKLNVTILPGHQSELINNIYVITSPEGFTVAHTGDQYSKEDLEWIRTLHEQIPPLDILLINCWANSLVETIDGFNPKLVITGHENELGHSIDHREPYWLSYDKLKEVTKPNCLMTWGEWFWFRRD